MTASELRRRLKELGCRLEEGRRHTIVEYQGRRSTIPRHPSQEIRTGTLRAILKQLGLQRRWVKEN